VGPTLAAASVAEIGEVDRFAGRRTLSPGPGWVHAHRESDTTVHRGSIIKQRSGLVVERRVTARHPCGDAAVPPLPPTGCGQDGQRDCRSTGQHPVPPRALRTVESLISPVKEGAKGPVGVATIGRADADGDRNRPHGRVYWTRRHDTT
jgi:hypothetical protein